MDADEIWESEIRVNLRPFAVEKAEINVIIKIRTCQYEK